MMNQQQDYLTSLQNGERAIYDGTIDTKIRISRWFYLAGIARLNYTKEGAADWLACCQGLFSIINPLLNTEEQKELKESHMNELMVSEGMHDVFKFNRANLAKFEEACWKFINKKGLGVGVKEDQGMRT